MPPYVCSLKCVGGSVCGGSAALLRFETANDILEAFELLVARGHAFTAIRCCCIDVGALLADDGHRHLHLLHDLRLLRLRGSGGRGGWRRRLEVELFDLFKAIGMYVEDTGAAAFLSFDCSRLETHLFRVEEVPVLVHVVVVRIQALLAEIAEVVLCDVALGAIIQNQVLLHAALTAGRFAYIK